MKARRVLTALVGCLVVQATVPVPVPAQAVPITAHQPVASDLTAEAAAKLQALIRIDTTNPPGNEAAAAQLIAEWLRAEGIEPELYESAPGRQIVIGRLKGRGDLPPLLLLNHLDVVVAEAERWKHPPFAGVIADGALWGRGALDMKGLGVMQLIAFLELKRKGVPLARDVIFCATPDEEAGGTLGAEWMLKHHPDAVHCSEVLNEGGAGTVMPSGAAIMGIQTAERGVCWIRVSAEGAPGHGSIDRPDGATRRLVRGLAKLEILPRRLEVVPEADALFQTIAETETGLRAWALRNLKQPLLLPLLGPQVVKAQPTLAPMLANTLNITVLQAGEKVNVMPGSAAAEIDIRMLPGYTVAQMIDWVRQTLDDPGLTIELIHGRDGNRSPASGPLFEALRDATLAEYPDIRVTHVITPGGGTDSAFFRERGIASYGLMPIVASAEQLATMHGDDEHITLDQLGRGTRTVVRAIEQASRITERH